MRNHLVRVLKALHVARGRGHLFVLLFLLALFVLCFQSLKRGVDILDAKNRRKLLNRHALRNQALLDCGAHEINELLLILGIGRPIRAPLNLEIRRLPHLGPLPHRQTA